MLHFLISTQTVVKKPNANMQICGRFSISEAVLSIAVGDILFSIGSLLVHMTEAFLMQSHPRHTHYYTDHEHEHDILINGHPTFNTNHTNNDNNSSASPHLEKLMLHPMSEEETRKNAKSILCWVYIGVNFINILMAVVLGQAVIKESILKIISYLVITPSLIILEYSLFLYHLLMLGMDSTSDDANNNYYYALVAYPFYYLYKFASLFVIYKFLKEIRTSPADRRRKGREKYERIGGGGGGGGGRGFEVSYQTSFSSTTSLLPNSEHDHEEEAQAMKVLPRRFEIPPEFLKLDHTTSLGFDDQHSIIRGVLANSWEGLEQGEFVDVAVKTLKVTTPTIPYSNRLVKEAHLLAYIGDNNEHILKFYGVCVKPSLKEKLFLVTEFYPKGTLDEFFKDARDIYQGDTFTNLLDSEGRLIIPFSRKVNDLPKFDTFDTLTWVYQIASGMEYLHNKRVIHGCLQAKSIILVDSTTVKLWNFSFASKLKQSGYTVKRDELPNRFPWRWSALECLTAVSSDTIRFSTRTDVWAYGVTLWEIFSLGDVPYGTWDSDIVHELVNGVRLDKPKYCSQQIYEIMNSCWRPDALDRPNFYLVKLFFQQLLSSLQQRK